MKQRLLAGTAIVTVAAAGALAGTQLEQSATVSTVTARPVADAQVREASPSTNYGDTVLATDGGSGVRIQSALRFNVDVTGPITKATLRVRDSDNATADGPQVFKAATNSWSESGVTWQNRPLTSGDPVADVGAIAAGAWAEWDVTSAVQANGSYSFKLTQGSTDGARFYSREGTSPPELVLQVDTPPTTTTTTTTTITAPQPTDGFAGLPFSSGAVKFADYQTSPENVQSLWRYLTDGYFGPQPCPGHATYGFTDAADPQIDWSASGGDPRPAFDNAIHPGYRELDTAGNQSCYDKQSQPSSTRTQLGGVGGSDVAYYMPSGTRDLVGFSEWLDPATPLPYNVASGGGNTYYTQWWQQKSVSSSGAPYGHPTLIMYEGRDGFKLVYDGPAGLREYIFSAARGVPVPRGVWLRFALDIYETTSSSGAYRLWADLDGGALNFTPLTPKVSAPTIWGGNVKSAMNMGPYHKLTLPRNWHRQANVEIVEHPVGDPW
jgi:hypothetical protein